MTTQSHDTPDRLAARDVIDGLARAYDWIKPEPGMDGPHGGYLGGVTRQKAAGAIQTAIDYLAALVSEGGLDAWLLAHEHHTLFFGRENGGVSAIRCASCAEGDPHDHRFELAAHLVGDAASPDDARDMSCVWISPEGWPCKMSELDHDGAWALGHLYVSAVR